MKKITSLELRQSLSKVLSALQKTGEPVLLEKNRKPAAVIISLEDFQERFAEFDGKQKRLSIINEIRSLARPGSSTETGEEILRSLRGGKTHD